MLFFLCETWLPNAPNSSTGDFYKLNDYVSKFCSAGNGKGIASYSDPVFAFQGQIRNAYHQIMKYSTSFLHFPGKMVYIEIIGLYRSTGNLRDKELLSDLTSMVNKDNICIILGDFNLRYTMNNPHMVLQYLKNNSFCQLVDTPTHSRGGLIDHFYIRKPSGFENVIVNWHLYAPFYTDHFGVCVTINKGRAVLGN